MLKKCLSGFVLCVALGAVALTACGENKAEKKMATIMKTIALPAPQTTGGKPLMQALSERKTTRTFSDKKIPMQTLSNLLWAANGVNRPADKMRTSPSAHNAQEVEIYVSTAEGTYIYDAYANQLKQINEQDIRAATGKQDFVATAPVNLVYVADYSRFKKDDDETAKFYSATDTGFVSQNVYLFCASEGLVTMVRGYIDRPALEKLLGLNEKQHVILAQSVGYPK